MSIEDILNGSIPLTRRQELAVELASQDYGLIADLIRLREESGLRQEDVAEAIGVTQQSVSKFEQMDSDPRLSTIRRYALAVGALVTHRVEAHADQILQQEIYDFQLALYSAPFASTSSSGRVGPVQVSTATTTRESPLLEYVA